MASVPLLVGQSVTVLLLGASSALAAACDSDCDGGCPADEITVDVAASAGGSAPVSIVASGPACNAQTASCSQPQCEVLLTATGNCHIEVTFADGSSVAKDVQVTVLSGCCAGFSPVDPNDWQWQLGEPAADAGAD